MMIILAVSNTLIQLKIPWTIISLAHMDRITMEGGGLRRFNKIGAYYRITSLVQSMYEFMKIEWIS